MYAQKEIVSETRFHSHNDSCYESDHLLIHKTCGFSNPKGAVNLLPKGYKIVRTLGNKLMVVKKKIGSKKNSSKELADKKGRY